MSEIKSNHIGISLLSIAVIYLLVKVFFSLDFTDEMQYYGQIYNLVLNDKLFSGDLFFQQSVYLIFYPVFKIFFLLNPDLSYFVLFGRITYFSLILITVWSFLKLMDSFSVSKNVQLVASSLLIAILAHRIFGISYNTVSYCLVVIILSLWFRRDKKINFNIVSLCGAFLTITYPPVGISLIAILCSTLAFKKKYKEAFVFGTVAVFWFITIIGSSFLLGIIEYRGALEAINFSRNFGSVGSVQTVGLAGLGLIGFMSALILTNYIMIRGLPAKIESVLENKWVKIFILSGALILILMSSFHPQYWKLAPILIFLSIIYFALSIRLTKESHPEYFIFMNIGALIGLVYALASGDGFYQLPFGVSLLIPFMLFSIAIPKKIVIHSIEAEEEHERIGAIGLGLTSFLILVYLSVGHPYREDPVYKLDSFISDVPAFKGIYTTSVKNDLVSSVMVMVRDNNIEPNSSMLVVGPSPWIYFVAKANPVTPMFYMHFSGSGKIYEFLENRLEGARPDWVLYTGTMVDYSGLQSKSLKNFLRKITSGEEYSCTTGFFDEFSLKKYNPRPVYAIANPIDICKKSPPLGAGFTMTGSFKNFKH
jgi:hypothetical protein